MSSLSFRVLAGLAAVGLGASAFASAASADEGPPGTLVASGLNNPRHLTAAPNGDLYISESGAAGDDCIELEEEGPEGPETVEVCAGDTGSVTRLSHRGVQERVVTGLPSIPAPPATSWGRAT